ncbi:MAG: CARDB domain-containing protein [Acidobacteriota bacterium]
MSKTVNRKTDLLPIRLTLLIILALLPLQVSFAKRPAAQAFEVTAVTLASSPTRYEGPCPGVIKFSGSITVNGRGTVKYTFARSDGATGPVFTLNFDRAGTKPVETTWTLGGAALPTFTGWEAIRILSPKPMMSNKAGFTLTCQRAEPFRVTAARLSASPQRYEGHCPGIIKFPGTITANGKGTVKYTFLRSDNATAPVFTLVFDEPGTKPVQTTWTLGGATLKTYSGWEAIKILSPNVMESNRATFELICEQPQPVAKLDLAVAKELIKIGGQVGGAGAKSAISGGTITLTGADSFLQSGGKCAFNITYTVVNYGTVASTQFINRIRCDNEVVSIQSDVSVPAGATRQINTQAYLPPGVHVLTLSLDDEHTIAEANELNNVIKIKIIVNCSSE